MKTEMWKDQLQRLLKEFGDDEFQRGLKIGLEVAEKAVIWLRPENPENLSMEEVARWVETAIARAKTENGIND